MKPAPRARRGTLVLSLLLGSATAGTALACPPSTACPPGGASTGAATETLSAAAPTVASPAAPLEAPAPELVGPPPEEEARARAELQEMADFLARQDKLGVTVRASFDVVQADGQKLEFGEVRKTTLQRPDKLRVDALSTDGKTHELVYDGSSISVADPDEGVFTTVPAPGNLDDALDHFTDDLGMRFPLKNLVSSSLPTEIQGLVVSARYVGTAQLDGKTYDQIAARGKDADFQVWIPVEGDPLPARIVVTYRDQPGAPQFRASFRNWDLSPDLSASTFQFTPPTGAEQVAIIVPPQRGAP